MEHKRDQSLDIMKGIGILLVVFAHVYHKSGIVYLFHMPLFFILSGAAMTYSASGYSLKKKFKTLLVPYFVFSLLCFAYWAFVESRFRPMHDAAICEWWTGANVKLQQFVNIFTAINSKSAFVYNIVLWFLPCLFMAELVYSRIKDTKAEWIVDAICVIACYVLVSNSAGFVWCFGEAIVAVPLLSLGNKAYRPLMNILKRNIAKAAMVVVASVLVFASLYLLGNPHTDMAHNLIPHEFYPVAIAGSLCVITLSWQIDGFAVRGGQILAYLGRNSLIVMCVHEPLKRVVLMLVSKCISMPTDMMRDSFLISVGCTIFVVAVCIPIVEATNRKASWAIGRF